MKSALCSLCLREKMQWLLMLLLSEKRVPSEALLRE